MNRIMMKRRGKMRREAKDDHLYRKTIIVYIISQADRCHFLAFVEFARQEVLMEES
jgi:hypothetical protein